MEEDEELINKLMTMLGSGREIKIKSANGQTLKVCLDAATTEVEPQNEWNENFEVEQNFIQHLNNSTMGSLSNNDINDFLQDFTALSASQDLANKIESQINPDENSENAIDYTLPKSNSRKILYEQGKT